MHTNYKILRLLK